MDAGLILETHRETILTMVARRRASNPRLFGSVLKGRASPHSDVDILIDALPGATLFDLGGLQADLQELLGTTVDLLTPQDISPHFRATVLAEARPI